MNTYWIFCGIVLLVLFVPGEVYGFRHGDRQNTLSRCIWTLGQKWPLSIWLGGLICGALATHFFWNWCPALMPAGQGG